MSVTPISELNDRARDVFRLVVESYLGTGLPVASRTLSKLAGISLSPDRKSTRLNSSHIQKSRMPSSA